MICPGTTQADSIGSSIAEYAEIFKSGLKILFLPETERGKLHFPGAESRRAQALNQLLSGGYDLVIGSINAFTGAAPDPVESAEARIELRPGMILAPEELVKKLLVLDYDDEYETSVPGEFSRRGGIIDLYSPAHDFPCRIEYFGDEIETLRSFAPETQRSIRKLDSYQLIGRSGISAGGEAASDALTYIGNTDFLFLNVFPESSRARLRKYASEKALSRFDEFSVCCRKSDCERTFIDLQPQEAADEFPLPDIIPVFEKDLTGIRRSREESTQFRLNELKQKINLVRGNGGLTLFSATDDSTLENIKKWCSAQKIPSAAVEYDTATFRTGFLLPFENFLLITEKELIEAGFLRERINANSENNETTEQDALPPPSLKPEFSLADIDEGDFAVHIDHGIGIFRGFKILENSGSAREVIVMEYKNNQQIYIPLTEAHKLSRYVGAVSHVKLHAPNSSKWKNDCLKAGSGVRSYAADMLRLQAMRKSISGIPMRPDQAAEKIFLNDFPFHDTPDQKRGTVEICNDLAAEKPMDRLLCGDVGYGKTELAMRAAFRAVSAGYQVAVIAPTTVLAQQHYTSFCERFAKYPYVIDVLSRFRSQADQERTIAHLAAGGVDIVIGTHRLCSSRIKFRNLGLVVIDEEQRFGVQLKERLRRFRAEADVLSMSATPIPRTLYLAMAGARDLTTLMTPPKMRLPVKTVISPEDPAMIADAIRSELARGGQVYYLHNRVKTISATVRRLKELVPDCRFAAAHGQMPEQELENVMKDFLENRIDCLVCSTIIESGLDVPNANTIIIERADRFGLGELHQLRGRVGRWKNQAYAYMLMPKNTILGTDARKRLAAIRRCSNLGTGFQLALHDLEIRGSGNLLGSEQSGHLNAIGFDLYCQLLKQEIAALSGKKLELLPEVTVSIDFVSFAWRNETPGTLCCHIPPDYIPSERLRFDAFRRLGNLQSEKALDDFTEELRDRYGKLPEVTKNLLKITRIRILTALADYRQISVINGRISMNNPGGTIYRLADGTAPRIDYNDSLELRLHHLTSIVRQAAERR
ncbi:MAG: transcription-repair coupling factor [Lentisphaeria bacterium]|nr:transcription-repair coupling factor [Lentisphaeria bacterium]